MTPGEAVDQLLMVGMALCLKDDALMLIEAVRADETRRCAAFVDHQCEELVASGDYNTAAYVGRIRDGILRSGGLEVEE